MMGRWDDGYIWDWGGGVMGTGCMPSSLIKTKLLGVTLLGFHHA